MWKNVAPMEASRTTADVQRYLDELQARGADAPLVVRELLGRSALRLERLCSSMLRRGYPRLARPPHNLNAQELLGAVVERLIKALRKTRPATVRGFFGLAHQHVRWELDDLARRLDGHAAPVPIDEQRLQDPGAPSGASRHAASPAPPFTAKARRILAAMDSLGEDEREVFGLVRIQGLTHEEASGILGVSTKTVQRRLNRGRVRLVALLKDLEPQGRSSGAVAAGA